MVVAPLGLIINPGAMSGRLSWNCTLSEGADSGSFSELDGFEHPRMLARFESTYYASLGDPSVSLGGTDFPLVYDFPKGLVTIAQELYVQQTTNAAGLEEVSFRLYYSQIQIDDDDLVFLRSVR